MCHADDTRRDHAVHQPLGEAFAAHQAGIAATRAAVRELADVDALASVDVDGVAYWMPSDLLPRLRTLVRDGWLTR